MKTNATKIVLFIAAATILVIIPVMNAWLTISRGSRLDWSPQSALPYLIFLFYGVPFWISLAGKPTLAAVLTAAFSVPLIFLSFFDFRLIIAAVLLTVACALPNATRREQQVAPA